MTTKAAGILLLQKGLVLGFQKRGTDFLAIPCGKVEEGETTEQGAIREMAEETGLLVYVRKENNRVSPILHPPFTAVDSKGTEVTTYLANEFYYGTLLETEEGVSQWVEAARLVHNGPYKEYNLKMLTHFGVL